MKGGAYKYLLNQQTLNRLIQNLDEKQHLILLGLCAFTYIFFGTFHHVIMNYVSWFMVLYVIGSYLRLYQKSWYKETNLWGGLTVALLVLSSLSVISCAWLCDKYGVDKIGPYAFVSDSNTFLAVATGVSSFMLFKNLKIPRNRCINNVAASTFGVLCIHANSDIMRKWLWKDMLNNVEMYNSSYFVFHAVFSVVAIFIGCIIIDNLRIRLFDRMFLDKYINK